jgi:acyl carrier protein
MTRDPALERVQSIITGIVGSGQGPSDAGPDTPLSDGGFWLDSVHMLEALLACEAEFGIVFDPETDFTEEHLKTVRTLCDLIRTKTSR